MDAVFHVAARLDLGATLRLLCGQCQGTENVLQACQQAGVGRVVYTSTPGVVFNRQSHQDRMLYWLWSPLALPLCRDEALAEQRIGC